MRNEAGIRVALDATAIGRGKTGNETYLRGLLEGWKKSKPEGVELCPIFTEGHGTADWKTSHVLPKTGFFRRHLSALPKARARAKADLFHGVYWMRPWESGPYVLTVHDISFAVHPEWFRPGEAAFYTTLIRAAARKARKVITVSEFCRAEIEEKWAIPADRIETTHEAARSCFRPPKKRPNGPPTLLFVSAIHPRKNLVRLVQVWQRLRSGRFPDLRLRVIGPAGWLAGKELGILRGAVATGGATWEGSASDEELRQAYGAATLLVYPSLYEGFGLPPLEAMACGCPVVCSQAASLPEICAGAAEYFDPLSEEEMSAKIALLLGSEARRAELNRAGLLRAAEFSWEKMAEQTAEVYRRAIQEE